MACLIYCEWWPAQSLEQQQREATKTLGRVFNGWRVRSAQQQDLHVSAQAIALQWNREILLKKKVERDCQTHIDASDLSL